MDYTASMDDLLAGRIAAVMGKAPARAVPILRGRSPVQRYQIHFADGSSAFAKLATSKLGADALRREHALYAQLTADFMPELYGFDAGASAEQPLLLLEDLSSARWGAPWREGDTERALETLRRIARTQPLPPALPDLELDRARYAGWLQVERNAKPFLALGMCSREWLNEALPVLLMAQDLAILSGVDLVHGGVLPEKLCFAAERVVLVDWATARRGNAAFDLVSFAASARLGGGPAPEEIAADEGPLAALWCGFLAAAASLPPPPEAPRTRAELRALRIALPWAARALGLPAPDVAWARAATESIDAELAGGGIDEAGWYVATEEVIGDAYLGATDPRAQSGKSGDEAEWRWSRELVLDALPPGNGPFHVLDAGAANGYLLESLVRWGRERSAGIEPHGLEISERLAALSRRRLPRWASRIATGNVLLWQPPRRYDLVHTGLDYVPPARRRELLERVQREFLTPGGRLVLRPERVRAGEADLVEQVEALGVKIGGVLESVHPTTKEVRRTVWLGAR